MKRLYSTIRLSLIICTGIFLLNCSHKYKDQNGNVFKSVSIGNQEWMAENLNVVTFRNGDSIPQAKTNEEWLALSMELGMNSIEANKLHERGTNEGIKLKDPDDRNWNLNDSVSIKFSGFNAHTGGGRINTGEFVVGNECAFFWSSTETARGGAFAYGLHPDPFFYRCDDNKGIGMSVRCIKDK